MEIIGGLPELHGAVEGGCSSIEPGNGCEEQFAYGGDVAEAEGSGGSQDASAFAEEGGFVGVVESGFEVEKEIDGVVAQGNALSVALDKGDGRIGCFAGASDACGEKFDADDARGGEFLSDPSRGAADSAADIEDDGTIWDRGVSEESPDEFALKIGERAGCVWRGVPAVVGMEAVGGGHAVIRLVVSVQGVVRRWRRHGRKSSLRQRASGR